VDARRESFAVNDDIDEDGDTIASEVEPDSINPQMEEWLRHS